ncbi:putative homocysteine S-methyltransferase [Xylariaceae sp. FL0662B]|nr:putative homocysteine S-methyltransferase [Xylariaceae sp. FL0662B]
MGRIQILDGGLGTSLVDKYDVSFDDATPLWSTHLLITGRETLLACQRDFVQAGVDVLLTATYQASIEGFARTKTSEHPGGIPKSAIGSYLRVAVDVALQAAEGHDATKIALSLGPYGACMTPGQEYSGRYDEAHDSEESLYRWHLERMNLFVETEGLMERLHIVAFETIPRVDEIRAVRRAMASCGATLPFWISCVFPGEDDLLPDGSTVDQVVEAMLDPTVQGLVPWGIGINCTKLSKLPRITQSLESSVRKMRSQNRISSWPSLVLYPDGANGKVYNTTTKKWELSDSLVKEQSKTPWAPRLASLAKDLRDAGDFESILIGGCCKTSAEDIAALIDEVKT